MNKTGHSPAAGQAGASGCPSQSACAAAWRHMLWWQPLSRIEKNSGCRMTRFSWPRSCQPVQVLDDPSYKSSCCLNLSEHQTSGHAGRQTSRLKVCWTSDAFELPARLSRGSWLLQSPSAASPTAYTTNGRPMTAAEQVCRVYLTWSGCGRGSFAQPSILPSATPWWPKTWSRHPGLRTGMAENGLGWSPCRYLPFCLFVLVACMPVCTAEAG